MTNVFAVVGQHRTEPGRLLLLGEDGRYYAYAANGQPSGGTPGAAWRFDDDERPEGFSDMQPSPSTAVSDVAAPVRVSPRAAITRWLDAVRLIPARRLLQPLVATMIAIVLSLSVLVGIPAVLADAPGLGTVTTIAPLLAEPDPTSPLLAFIPVGVDVELTGNAEGSFLEIMRDGQQGWTIAALLDTGGSELATVPGGTTLHTEPFPDAPVVAEVPPGSTVILTGAEAEGYLAASFEGAGGWIAADAIDEG